MNDTRVRVGGGYVDARELSQKYRGFKPKQVLSMLKTARVKKGLDPKGADDEQGEGTSLSLSLSVSVSLSLFFNLNV